MKGKGMEPRLVEMGVASKKWVWLRGNFSLATLTLLPPAFSKRVNTEERHRKLRLGLGLGLRL